jgi:hypothetical protein
MSPDPEERPRVEPVEHMSDDADEVMTRPTGTRSFVYGAKTLATSVVALLLVLLVDEVFAPAFWVLLAAGLLGVMFSIIERSTTVGAEVVSHRRVNLDVLGTVILAAAVMVIVVVLQR